MAKPADATGKTLRPNLLPITVLLVGAVAVYGILSFQALFNGHSSAAEISYLVRSWWYASGIVAPYTATDATGQMPLYFYQLGFWQQLQGLGHVPGRMLSIGCGALSGVLLYLICKRLTANSLAAAAAVFVYLATPATVIMFANATPVATVALLHLVAVYVIVLSLGKQRLIVTVIMGLICTALYFYNQSMIVAVIALVPLYVIAIGRQRPLHTAILLATIAAASALLVISFPEKMGAYALHLPVISPLLEKAGLLAPNFVLIDKGTTGAITMAPAFERFAPAELLNTFLLPYSGTIILALVLLGVAGGPLRVLWAAPLYFLWLALGHYFGSLGFCDGCMVTYAPAFAAIGALAGGLALTMVAVRFRAHGIPAGPPILIGAVIAVGLNTFAPNFATSDTWRYFPIQQLAQPYAASELEDIDTMARWIASNTPAHEPMLILHSLGKQKLPTLPYSAFLAGHMIPVQSLNPAASRRTLATKLSPQARESVQGAIEDESLWTDETLGRWLERDYDIVLFQEDRSTDQRAMIAAISKNFEVVTSTVFRGSNVFLYKRKSVQ